MGSTGWGRAMRLTWSAVAAATLLALGMALGLGAVAAMAADPITTSIAVTQDPGYVYIGDEVTVTATITPNPGGGVVRFSHLVGGAPVTDDVAVDPDTGAASLAFAAIPYLDNVNVHAWFQGTTGFASSEASANLDVRALPNAVITESPSPATSSTSASIAFVVSPGISTKCRLDGAAAAACASPVELSGLAEGSHTLDVIPFGADKRDGQVASTTWFTDLTGPVPGDVVLDDGEATTNRSSVELDVPATDALSGIERVRISRTGELGPDGLLAIGEGAYPMATERSWAEGPSLTWAFDRSKGSGPQTVWVQWIDVAGNPSTVVSRTIDLRVASATLGDGAWQTETPNVAFAIEGVDPAEVVSTLISNSPGFVGDHLLQGIERAGIPSTWNLEDPLGGGTSAAGSKIVYVQWKDTRGRWSDVFGQAIADRPLIPVDAAFDEGTVTASPLVHAAFVTADLAGRGVNVAFWMSCDGTTWATYPLDRLSQSLRLDDAAAGCPAEDGERNVHLRWQLIDCCVSGGTASTERVVPITLDSTAPARPSVPRPAIAAAGSALAGGSAPIRVSWPAITGMHFEIRQSVDGHVFGSPITVTASSLVRLAAPGHAYRFSIRAVDSHGKFGAWSNGPALQLRAISQASSALRYRGRWADSFGSAWWGGSARHSSTTGSTVTMTFTGKSVAWVGMTAPNRGKAWVFVNGKRVATIDLRSTSTRLQRIVWSATYATSATRTVTIQVLGTAGRPRVDIDGFVVGG